jgi:hypothetical protein
VGKATQPPHLRAHTQVSLCQMPYLLTPEAKSHILHGESMMQKQHIMSAHAMQVCLGRVGGVGEGGGTATTGTHLALMP